MYREGLSGVNLCFSTQDGAVSWLLRKAMKIPASHCMITFRSDALDTVLAMEVQGRGFVIVPHHWDDFFRPLDAPVGFSLNVNVAGFLDEVAAVSKDVEIRTITPLEPVTS